MKLCKCGCGLKVTNDSNVYVHGHHAGRGCSVPNKEFILNNIVKIVREYPTECWEWSAGCFISGYGRFVYKAKTYRAHRVSFTLWKKEIPGDKLVLHKCDNRKCVRPSHLYLGNHHNNMEDMKNRERQARGKTCHLSKLKAEQVREIRALLAKKVPQTEIAKMFGMSTGAINGIAKNRTWKHIK